MMEWVYPADRWKKYSGATPFTMKSDWTPVWCPRCGREAFAKYGEWFGLATGYAWIEVAPHWDWLNRICVAINTKSHGLPGIHRDVANWRLRA